MRKPIKIISYLATFLSIGITISACSTVTSWWHPSEHQGPVVKTEVAQNAETYLERAMIAPPPEQQALQLQAVRRLIQEQHLTRAGQILATVDTNGIPRDLTAQKQLLSAKIHLANNQPRLAVAQLTSITNQQQLTQKTRQELLDTLANAYEQTGQTTLSVFTRNRLNQILPDQYSRFRNQLAIWNSVQHLPADKIDSYLSQPQSDNVRGWLKLSKALQSALQNPGQLSLQLAEWKSNYPDHPGNDVLPEQIDHPQQYQAVKKVALILPLHGKYGRQGQAIRNGFMTAYFQAKSNAQTTPQITVIDSSTGDIQQQYQKAVDSGANFIVGPLTKNHIQQLVNNTSLSIPTLALNNVDGIQVNNLYQFGLNQTDEAIQAANHAALAGFSRAIIIAPATEWGQQVANVFAENWQQQGGMIVDRLAYSSSRNLASNIRNLLEVDKSESRATDLKNLLKQKNMRFVPQRRHDIDMIFLVARPAQARTIQPMLKFYFAGNLPVYSTSSIFSGRYSPRQDQDLEGLQFSEMPFVVNKMPTQIKSMKANAQKTWKKSFSRDPKLYALGIDAYQLLNAIPQLQLFPRSSVQGATGVLYLQSNNHVYRQLPWTKMQNGKPSVIR